MVVGRVVEPEAGGGEMQFNVAQLLKEPGGATRRYEIDEDLVPSDGGAVLHVRGVVKMLKTGEGVWVGVSLESRVLSQCSRCLTEMDVPVQVEFDEEYFPLALGPTEARGLEAVDESQYIDYDNILDIGVAAGQYLTMAVPMKPMCREDCAGICQSCGADLNKGACTCAERDRDARWAALRGLAIATPDIQNLSEN